MTDLLLTERVPRKIVLSSVSSDAHTWNLVFLQLVLEEMGHSVINLGACVPDEDLIDACLLHGPDAVVISTVNGHGYADGKRLIGKLRARLAELPVVIGGKLGVSGADDDYAQELVDLGYSAVFSDNQGVEQLGCYIETIGLGRVSKSPSAIAGPDVVPGVTAGTPKDNQYSRRPAGAARNHTAEADFGLRPRADSHRTGTSIHGLEASLS